MTRFYQGSSTERYVVVPPNPTGDPWYYVADTLNAAMPNAPAATVSDEVVPCAKEFAELICAHMNFVAKLRGVIHRDAEDSWEKTLLLEGLNNGPQT